MSTQDSSDDACGRSESVLTEKPTVEHDVSEPAAADSVNIPASPTSTNPLPTTSDRVRSLTNDILHFIGNASNETLGACAVGLAASTYLVLGRLGLVLIGTLGGIILGSTWNHDTIAEGKDATKSGQRKRELGIEVAKRALDLRSQDRQGEERTPQEKIEASTSQEILDFSQYPSQTAAALTSFSDAVIQDYVKYWYSPILPTDRSFPTDCQQILIAFINSFSNHVSRKRAADPFLDFIANSTSVIIVFLQELALALKASQRAEAEEALTTYLQFQPDSNLANVLNKEQQKRKLHIVADDILQNFLDSKTYNCLPARTFLSEILAGLILDGTLISCSRPEWINEWIVYLLEDNEPALLDAIDAGVTELERNAKVADAPVEDVAQKAQHKRRVSRAEQAMQDAMMEAQRINEMIAQDEARKRQAFPTMDSEDALSTTTTTDTGVATPISSDEEPQSRPTRAVSNPMVFDNEGNAIPSVAPSPAKPVRLQSTFTDFDQLEQLQSPIPVQPTSQAPSRTESMIAIPLTLHNASINIIELGMDNPQVVMRQRPDGDMMVQIEPASSRFPGWIVTRQFATFEPLHETLRRIANISGASEFNIEYPELPSWRGQKRELLIHELERYLRTALKFERLAESEAMKRFLEKETGLDKIPSSQKNVFIQAGNGLENVGKGFVNVLGQGGKGLQAGGKVFQTGGKAVLGGVTGVFGTVASGLAGPKRPGLSTNNSSSSVTRSQQPLAMSARQSHDSSRQSTDHTSARRQSPQLSMSVRSSMEQSRASQDLATSTSPQPDMETMNLPPPPDMMTDEYEAASISSPTRQRPNRQIAPQPSPSSSTMRASTSETQIAPKTPSMPTDTGSAPPRTKPRTQDIPISDEETRMTVELMFALITELLSLSSAWTFRLSLLTAAKSYLLRPNNPQLKSIRTLLQESLIDANTSDAGIAAHIRKLRENALPTEEELKEWPKEPSEEEKEKLRVKARKLLVERGMPQALTTVVGIAASGEALGKVFDCLQNRDVARVYTVAGSSAAGNIPEWVKNKKRKKGHDYANHIELLQDFEFEEASQCIRISEDGEWAMSTGTYKPQIHTHYLPNLALSFARHTDTINKTFLFLSSDYSKSVHLQEDRSIEFHTPGGCHYKLRIPRYGRDLIYDRSSTELYVPAVGVNANGMGEVFRINLELGRFMNEFEIDVGGDDMTSAGGGALQGGIGVGGVNTGAVAEASHGLLAFGTTLGTVEYWDPRVRTRVASVTLPIEFGTRPEVTAIDFHRSGIRNAVGTSSGLIYLYDLRSPVPTLKKDQGYDYPIQHVQFLTSNSSTRSTHSEPKVLSGDKRILKIWEERDGTPWTSVEPEVDINCVAWCPDSGMILTANEGKQQHAFLIPQLGPAPKWCAFLDNVVEEMADDPNDPNAYSAGSRRTGEVYDNFKFLTTAQLRTLNLDHLVGKTNLLRPYMHGFFVAQKLYEEARLIANPTTYEEERSKRVQEKIEKERESRIRGQKKVTAKVNRKLAERILEREAANERKRAQKVLAQGGDEKAVVPETVVSDEKGLLADSRFAQMFEQDEFMVDEASREFQAINPSTKVAPRSNLDHERGLTAVEEDMIDEVPGSDEDSDAEDFSFRKQNGRAERVSTADYKRRPEKKKSKQKGGGLSMQVSSSKAGSRAAGRQQQDRSFGDRAANFRPDTREKRSGGVGVVGEKTISFAPASKKKARPDFDSGRSVQRGDRRSASKNQFRGM
ncbi:Small ribosomal subunit biogenesis [Lithohypha guttulata]|nr:Small ribosomal subunit biogenesis [Lithohypha guttulata]